jgi:hypothetical protein
VLDRIVKREVTVESGDLECAPRLDARRSEQKAVRVRKSRPRLDQDAECRRVHELHVAQIDDEPLGAFVATPRQRLANGVRVVEIELACEPDDDGPFPADAATDPAIPATWSSASAVW